MQEFKEEFIFTLARPFLYHDKGAEVSCNQLILKAPSNKHRRQTARLKQGLFRAFPKDDGKTKDKEKAGGENGEITGTQVLTLIMMSQVDLVDYQENFRELLLNDAAMVSDSQRLTAPLYDKMCDQDTQMLMGEYVATFLLSSLMKRLQSQLNT